VSQVAGPETGVRRIYMMTGRNVLPYLPSLEDLDFHHVFFHLDHLETEVLDGSSSWDQNIERGRRSEALRNEDPTP